MIREPESYANWVEFARDLLQHLNTKFRTEEVPVGSIILPGHYSAKLPSAQQPGQLIYVIDTGNVMKSTGTAWVTV